MAQLNDLIVIGKARFLNTINGTITNASTATYAGTAGAVTWPNVSSKPSTFAPVVGNAATQAAAGNHNHDGTYYKKTDTVSNATCATNASSVNGKTVATSVPSGAVFTDTKVTSVGNHYTPSTNNASSISKSASKGSAGTWGSTNMVSGITLKRDAAGHVTDMELASVALPANPNTDHLYYVNNGLKTSSTSGYNTTFTIDTAYAFNLSNTTVAKAGNASSVNGYTVAKSVPSNAVFTDTNTTYSFSNSAPTLSWGNTSTVGTVGGTKLTVTMPSNPNTDYQVQTTNADTAVANTMRFLFTTNATTSGKYQTTTYKSEKITYLPSTGQFKVIQRNSDKAIILDDGLDIKLSGSGNTWDGTNTSLKTALASVVTYKDFTCTSASVPANGSKEFASVNVAKTGYTPIGFLKYNTGDGSITPVNLYLEGTSAILVLRNISSSAKSVAPTFRILYMKS